MAAVDTLFADYAAVLRAAGLHNKLLMAVQSLTFSSSLVVTPAADYVTLQKATTHWNKRSNYT